jgi:hypothetical protein
MSRRTGEPGDTNQRAIYGCFYPTKAVECGFGSSFIAPVGATPGAVGFWGHRDLVGEVYELWIEVGDVQSEVFG